MALERTIQCSGCGKFKKVMEASNQHRTICHECEKQQEEERLEEYIRELETKYPQEEIVRVLAKKLLKLEEKVDRIEMRNAVF